MAKAAFSAYWEDHNSELATVCTSLLESNFLVDCTIFAEGQSLKAHRLVLSACSPYFHMLFREETGKHPFIILLDTSFEVLKAVIGFVYSGETQISEGNLKAFMALARSLQIKGLNAFSKDFKNEHPSGNNTRNTPQGLFEDQDPCAVQNTTSSHKDNSGNCSQQHLHPSGGRVGSAPTDSPVAVEGCSVSVEDVQSPQEYETPLQWEEVPSDSEITLKHEALCAEFSPTRNEVLDSCSESSNGNVESSVMPPSQQRLTQLSDEVSSGRDGAERDGPLLPTILVPKSEHLDEKASKEPMDDTGVSGNDLNETDEETELANIDMSASAGAGVLRENNLKTQLRSGMRLRARRAKIQSHQGADPASSATLVNRQREEQQHRCALCGSSFAKSHDLVVHRRTHTGERPYRCEACGESFAHRSTLVVHLRRHTGERPYRCGVCAKTFAQPTSLRNHKRTHTRERPYRCDVCGHCFSRGSHLARHKLLHSRDGPFRCGACGGAFAQLAALGKHLRIHTDARMRHGVTAPEPRQSEGTRKIRKK